MMSHVFPHLADTRMRPLYLKLKKPQGTAVHLEMVLMSRLVRWGLPAAAHPLVKKILHHGFHDGHSVTELEAALGRSRRLILWDLGRCELPKPSRWLQVCRLIYVVWIHFRLRGAFDQAVKHLGRGSTIDLQQLCKRTTGITPGQAHRECLEANSILPFMDRCIPHLMSAPGTALQETA